MEQLPAPPPFFRDDDYCACAARVLAEDAKQFVYAKPFRGYVFPKGVRRRCGKEVWQVPENHTGDPYVFTTCPWCGRALELPGDP